MFMKGTGKALLPALLAAVMASTVSRAHAYDVPRNLEQGWDGNIELGALATFGATDSSAISVRTGFTYRGEHAELELNTRLYRSASESLVTRRNADGDEVKDADGIPVKDLVRNTTNDRRFIGIQPRWFFTRRHYLFALADFEVNEPADIELSTRQVSGVGYKLWKSRSDYASAAIGIGRKKLVQVSGASDEGAIGYVGLRFKRGLSETVSVNLELDTDFGGENRLSEAAVSLAWQLRGPVAVKFKYEARDNSNIINPLNTFDEGVEAALSVSLEVDVF